MQILDGDIVKGILSVTCDIFIKNFYYDKESLGRFLNIFNDIVGHEIEFFASCIENREYCEILQYDPNARKEFTCYFISMNLHDIMVHDLHFTDQELDCFDCILPKYTGVFKHEPKPRVKRKNH